VNELLTPALTGDTGVVRHNIGCMHRIRNAISRDAGPVWACNGRVADDYTTDTQHGCTSGAERGHVVFKPAIDRKGPRSSKIVRECVAQDYQGLA